MKLLSIHSLPILEWSGRGIACPNQRFARGRFITFRHLSDMFSSHFSDSVCDANSSVSATVGYPLRWLYAPLVLLLALAKVAEAWHRHRSIRSSSFVHVCDENIPTKSTFEETVEVFIAKFSCRTVEEAELAKDFLGLPVYRQKLDSETSQENVEVLGGKEV